MKLRVRAYMAYPKYSAAVPPFGQPPVDYFGHTSLLTEATLWRGCSLETRLYLFAMKSATGRSSASVPWGSVVRFTP